MTAVLTPDQIAAVEGGSGDISGGRTMSGFGRAIRLPLPTEPGTVIAIGEWWLVRLRSYEGAPSAWELLPMPSKLLADRARASGVSTQCIYGDEWVQAEVEQEGSYLIVSEPSDTLRGVKYFSRPLGRTPEETAEDTNHTNRGRDE